MATERTLCLIDGSAYVFRAYHAVRGLTNSKGMATNALFGYVNMLLKAVRELAPTHVVVALESLGPGFRKARFAEYKANRPPAPPDLKQQLPYVEPLTNALGIAAVRAEGYEADDVIATLAARGRREGFDVVIVSGDKDLMQLVGEGICMMDPMQEKRWGPEQVKERFGVLPSQMADLLAIMGDASDNVPGVAGIGAKGAAQLVSEYGSLDAVLANAERIANKRQQAALSAGRQRALLSRELVTLALDAPVPQEWSALQPRPRDVEALRRLFTELEFRSLLRELLPGSRETVPARGPSPSLASTACSGHPFPPEGEEARTSEHPSDPLATSPTPTGYHNPAQGWVQPYPGGQPASGTPVVSDGGQPASIVVSPRMPDPVVVQRIEQLEGLVRKIVAAGGVSVDTETTSTDPVAARLVGISLCVDPQTVAYLPVAHRGEGQVQLPLAEVKRVLGPVLADPQLKKTGQHFKYDQVVLQSHGFAVDGLAFDSMLASYVLNPSRLSHGLDALAAEFLGVRTISYKEVTSRGGEQVLFDLVPVRDAARYSGEDAWVALLLREKLVPMVEQAGLASLLYDVEVPLSSVLAGMELCGVKVDVERLHALSREFEARLLTIEREVHQLAGAPFNIGSPKQLGEVLFEKLQLPTRKKTKTGYSTDVQVLEELASLHPLPARVLEYRSLSKLKSTYADVLPTLVNPKTGRVHTSFNQAATATGRLSSSDPNLQNIPVRQDEGRKIREAFIHEPGRVLLSADYSQIELRVLAHLCGDKTLMAAFRSGEDIHTRTAAEIFHVLPGLVTRQQRGMAKTVNFGILYGMSAFRLSREYGISNKEAKAFIDAYFARYPKVKEFADRTVRQAAETGMVETLLKRRRYVPEVRAQAAQVRAAGERIAVNTPVQGSAADIVKLAMLALERRLRDARLPAAMVLQVHDELVLEVAAGREKEVAEVVRDAMEKVLTLDVPLKVDVGTGDNWAQIH